ncbi:MAG: heat-inducible transcriptional repressor HrcA [Candidatus Omnitrophota bacterium]
MLKGISGQVNPRAKQCNAMKNKELELRKNKVLEAVIRSYVRETVPVSSSALLSSYGFEWSSATIRNVMAQLEEEGFLKQPHASAGRIPTDKGYRCYVDNIMKLEKTSPEKEISIRQQYNSSKPDNLGKLVEKTARIICAITNQASLAMMPSMNLCGFDKIDFIQLSENRALVVFLTSSGMVENIVIKLPKNINVAELLKVQNLLNTELLGYSLGAIQDYLLNEIKRREDAVFNIVKNAFDIIELLDINNMNNELFFDGLSLIMDKPEFKDVDKSLGVLRVLEEKTEILEIMNGDLEEVKKDIRVHIGSENIFEDIRHCSLITTKYGIGRQGLGMLGVIGPTRMAYEEVISMLDCVSDVLTEILSEE